MIVGYILVIKRLFVEEHEMHLYIRIEGVTWPFYFPMYIMYSIAISWHTAILKPSQVIWICRQLFSMFQFSPLQLYEELV